MCIIVPYLYIEYITSINFFRKTANIKLKTNFIKKFVWVHGHRYKTANNIFLYLKKLVKPGKI